MPRFVLNADQRRRLAACIEIGLEGAPDDEANEIVGTILDELQESEADETIVHIAPTPIYKREIAAKHPHELEGLRPPAAGLLES